MQFIIIGLIFFYSLCVLPNITHCNVFSFPEDNTKEKTVCQKLKRYTEE